MSPSVAQNLALILFLPWYLVILIVYWRMRRKPARWGGRVFDLAAIAVSIAAAAIAGPWALAHADDSIGSMWPQILATVVGYGAFLAVITLAALLRRMLTQPPATSG
jgi:hypothetical protein